MLWEGSVVPIPVLQIRELACNQPMGLLWRQLLLLKPYLQFSLIFKLFVFISPVGRRCSIGCS